MLVKIKQIKLSVYWVKLGNIKYTYFEPMVSTSMTKEDKMPGVHFDFSSSKQ